MRNPWQRNHSLSRISFFEDKENLSPCPRHCPFSARFFPGLLSPFWQHCLHAFSAFQRRRKLIYSKSYTLGGPALQLIHQSFNGNGNTANQNTIKDLSLTPATATCFRNLPICAVTESDRTFFREPSSLYPAELSLKFSLLPLPLLSFWVCRHFPLLFPFVVVISAQFKRNFTKFTLTFMHCAYAAWAVLPAQANAKSLLSYLIRH